MKIFVIVGINRNLLYRIASEIFSNENTDLYYENQIKWNLDSSTVNKLDYIIDQIYSQENSNSKSYLVGASYLNHINYIDSSCDAEIKTLCIHSNPDVFFDIFLEKYQRNLPFFEDNSHSEYFPSFKFDSTLSAFDYTEKYFYGYESDLEKVGGFHVFEEDFKASKREEIKRFCFESLDLDLDFEVHDKSVSNDVFSDVGKNEIGTKFFSQTQDNVSLLVNTFVLPTEFNLFYKQALKFKEALKELNQSNDSKLDISWRVHLDLSDFYVKWENSEIPKEFFYSSFYNIKGEIDDYIEQTYFTCFDDNIHGCNDIRRDSINKFSDQYDCFSWLDPDIIFSSRIFKTFNSFLPFINEKFFYYAISSEVFDSESSYLQPMISDGGFEESNPDFFNIESIDNKTVKILKDENLRLSGHFPIISTNFLKLTSIPEPLGHYGNDDIYINKCMEIFNNRSQENTHIVRLKLKNSIVAPILSKNRKKHDGNYDVFLEERDVGFTNKKLNHQKTENVLDKLYNQFKIKYKNI